YRGDVARQPRLAAPAAGCTAGTTGNGRLAQSPAQFAAPDTGYPPLTRFVATQQLSRHREKPGGIGMAANPPAAEGPRPTLGLTGLTVNAMALIAPGAFLWTTFQAQSALANGSQSTASNMWFALIASIAIAFLTALCY